MTPEPAKAMVGADILARQVARYGLIVSNELAVDSIYDETPCDECAYDHRCCDLMVTVTPYEALGIISWLKANKIDWRVALGVVGMRANVLREFSADEKGKPRFENTADMVAAWSARKVKCALYDVNARDGKVGCSIYPVRPVNCRKAFGKGDCGDEKLSGIQAMDEDSALFVSRSQRVRVRQLEAMGQQTGELCSLITMLRSPDVQIIAEPADQKLMHTEPETLTDDQILWGLGARPMENVWNEEESHG